MNIDNIFIRRNNFQIIHDFVWIMQWIWTKNKFVLDYSMIRFQTQIFCKDLASSGRKTNLCKSFLYRHTFPHLLLFPCLWALPRYSWYPVFISYGLFFWKCTFKVWNPTIYQVTDFACQVLCGMNFWVDKLQTLLLSVTNVACHKIVIWFHLLHLF